MWDFTSCWKIIAVEVRSPGKCVFLTLWFYLHSQRFGVQPYGLSTAFSRPLHQSLWNKKWLKRSLDESSAPPTTTTSLLWTLHSFSLCKPEDGTFNNSIVSTSEFYLFYFVWALCTLPTHPTPILLFFFSLWNRPANCWLPAKWFFFSLDADSLNTSSWVPKFFCSFCLTRRRFAKKKKKNNATVVLPSQSYFLYS